MTSRHRRSADEIVTRRARRTARLVAIHIRRGAAMPPIRFLAVLGLLLSTAAASAGEVRAGLIAPSTALGRGLTYAIYLPETRADGERFPVVYLLHGYGASSREWIDNGRIGETLDGLIAAGEIDPLIAVMPDADKSWYVDSASYGGPGDYETAIVRDLVGEIDARYSTIADPAHRALAGNSMGGFGALRLAFFHPDTFAAVAALSPAIFAPDGSSSHEGQLAATQEELDRWYPATFGATFAPAIYRAQSPFARVEDIARRERPPRVLLSVGDDDFFGLYFGTLDMFEALRRAGIDAELRVVDGGHDWRVWRPAAVEALRFFDAGWRPQTGK